MAPDMNRREFIKESLLATTAGALTLGGAEAAQAQQAPDQKKTDLPATPPAPAQTLPQGKIGEKFMVSRVIIGGNLITYFTHSRDLSYVRDLVMRYNNIDKIMDTLQVAEQNGINTVSTSSPPHVIEVIKRYKKERGGKMQFIICQATTPNEQMTQYREDTEKLVDLGVDAIYLHGHTSDTLAQTGRVDLIAKAVEIVKMQGLPSGVGGHDIKVIEECEKAGVANDFYIKTFHHHNYPTAPRPDELTGPYAEVPGYWCKDPKALADLMLKVKKPWIAFKIMAAGAIPPKNAFQWAFEGGGDHILIGMFDWQIAEDVALARTAYEKSKEKRQRPWCS